MRLTGPWFAAVWWLFVAVGNLALVVGWFGDRCEACDIVNIARPYAIALAASGLLIAVTFRLTTAWRLLCAAIATVAVIIAPFRSVLPDAARCAPVKGANGLRIVAFNAWKENVAPRTAALWLLRKRPDVIVLVETHGAAAPIPALLAAEYPYRVSCNTRARCSTQILSRLAPTMKQPWGKGDAENRKVLSAAAMTVVSSGGHPVTVVAVHLSRPLPLGQQRQELSVLDRRLADLDPKTLVVAGDFNATPDSTLLGDFARRHRFRRVATGLTWPTGAAYHGIPSLLAIDHILVGQGLRASRAGRGPVIGSDHRPVFATLCFNPSGAGPPNAHM